MKNEIQHNILICNSQIKNVAHFKYPELSDKNTVIYEVVRIINHIPLFLEDHLKRLYNSAELENSKMLLKDIEIINSIKQSVNENQVENGNIKIEIHFSNGIQSLFLIYFIKHYYPTKYQYDNGVNVILHFIERKKPNAKILNLYYKKKVEAIIKGNLVYEVLLVNKKGFITEGSKSNVFFIKGNTLHTAPENLVLSGVTRKYIFEIAKKMTLDINEQSVNINNLEEFDSAFITGTSPKVLPIDRVNGYKFNVKNKLLIEIMNAYNHKIDSYIFKKSYF